MSNFSPLDLEAYFRRVNYSGTREPTLETLRALNFAHVCAIPFENLDILLGRGIPIDLATIEKKIVRGGRGGYCFEQNTLFSAVLRQMGFAVTTLAARVRWNVAPETATPRTHMVLLVDLDRKRYVVDVAFGGVSLSWPIELLADVEQQTVHGISRLLFQDGLYTHQTKRNGAWLDVYRFTLEPHGEADYILANWYTSTFPNSRFRQNMILVRAGVDRQYSLQNRDFIVRKIDGAVEKRAIQDPEELLQVLRDAFFLDFPEGTRFGSGEVPWPV